MNTEEVHKLMLMLGEIKGDIKSLHEKSDTTIELQKYTNGRVTTLEHWKTGLMSKMSVLAIVISGVWAVIMKTI